MFGQLEVVLIETMYLVDHDGALSSKCQTQPLRTCCRQTLPVWQVDYRIIIAGLNLSDSLKLLLIMLVLSFDDDDDDDEDDYYYYYV